MKRKEKNISHIIYHIPGRKVGCTKDLNGRLKYYGYKESIVPELIILEKLYNKTDQEAGDIEWKWADKLGYKRETHYSKTIKFVRFRSSKQDPEIKRQTSKRTATRMAAEKNTPAFKSIKCPHCSTVSNAMIMKRWHFDNCWALKLRKERLEKQNK